MPIAKSTPLQMVLYLGKSCRQCGHCCRFGSGFVLKDDIKNIAAKMKIDEKEFIEKYAVSMTLFNKEVFKFKTNSQGKCYGECIFLKENKCSINDFKPLHCMIGNCGEFSEQLSAWFHLNYLVDKNDPESIRQWAVYLNSGGIRIPGGSLEELVPDAEKLKKMLNYEILNKEDKNG